MLQIKNSRLRIFLCILLGLLAYPLQAQDIGLSNLRYAERIVASDTLLLDSLSIIPSSLVIRCIEGPEEIATNDYELNFVDGQVIWKNRPSCDSIAIRYRVFAHRLNKQYSLKEEVLLQSSGSQPLKDLSYRAGSAKKDIFDLGGLDYTGSFSRGISFGNTQDLVVNSNFNLEMSGKLRNDVEILAAISDNTIPFQPEGNTQQLQEFDRIFIQLSKGRSKLIAGDFPLRRPESYFLNFNKKLQGLSASTSWDVGANSSMSASASAAVARGNFTRNNIIGEEGNQGPYKLRGGNNELFIIVLSGTERVYINGVLMKRGTELDYVIDYNAAELTFTNRRLITKDSRISVEFEYSNVNYLRSTLHWNTAYESEKLSLRGNFYQEGDSKNQPVAESSLGEAQKMLLRSIGDDLDAAVLSGVNPTGYVEDAIQYTQMDTLVNGLQYLIYVFAADSADRDFTISFSDFGQGNGNYVLSDRTINGRVYEWVAPNPVTGEPLGRFEPVTKVVSPNRKRMWNLGMDYRLGKRQTLTAEAALSDHDLNTFSDIDNEDNRGLALKLAYSNEMILDTARMIGLSTGISQEFVGAQFRAIERWRAVEFTRDWNVLSSQQQREESISQASAALNFGTSKKLSYGFTRYAQKDWYEGFRHLAVASLREGEWWLEAKANLVTTEDSLYQTQYFRPSARVERRWGGKWLTGMYWERERNEVKQEGLLNSRSLFFDEATAYISNADSSKNHIGFQYIWRKDQLPSDEQFESLATGQTFSLKGRLGRSARHQFIWDLSYRSLEVHADTVLSKNDNGTILANLQYNWAVWKGLIKSNTQYRISSGQTQVVDFEFIPTADRSGNYLFQDRNQNGIRELSEFLLVDPNDQTQDTLYRKILIPTDQYVKTNNLLFNQILFINPAAKWYDTEGWKNVVSRFSTQTNWQINRKLPLSEGFKTFNPLLSDYGELQNDSTASSISSSLRNSLFFNRSRSNFGAELYQQVLFNNSILLGGSDSRSRKETGLILRYNISTAFSAKLSLVDDVNRSTSTAISENNYQINSKSYEPSLTWILGTKFRLTTSYLYKDNESRLTLEETDPVPAIIHQLSFDCKYGIAAQRNVTAKLSYASVDFEGDANAPYVYQMLDSFQSGDNFLWALSYDTKLGKQIQLSLVYDGRKTEGNKARHVGRAQLRAIF